MDVPSLRETHPQKYYFKAICRIMYYLGVGDFWYEKTNVSYYKEKLYIVWSLLWNGYMFLILSDELLSYARTDMTEREQNDLVQFTFAHPVVCCKILTLYIHKSRIRIVMERLLEGSRSIFHSIELERLSVKQFARHCFSLICVSYLTLIAATLEGIRLHFVEDIPIGTEVVYYPKTSDTGVLINVLRFIIQFHWYCIVAMMVAIDCLALCSLITVGHKFRVLRLYFRNLRIRTMENKEKKTRRELEEDFKKDFVIAIKLHIEALWCARNIQQSMGPVYSIQVVECVGLLVMCLIKIVVAERNFINLLASIVFIICLITITGAYMMAAGDITNEAYLVGTSIFHSGWEHCQQRANLRALVVLALQMSQVPIHMTAFGVIILSHTNFISVLRSSYSFFAVMY